MLRKDMKSLRTCKHYINKKRSEMEHIPYINIKDMNTCFSFVKSDTHLSIQNYPPHLQKDMLTSLKTSSISLPIILLIIVKNVKG